MKLISRKCGKRFKRQGIEGASTLHGRRRWTTGDERPRREIYPLRSPNRLRRCQLARPCCLLAAPLPIGAELPLLIVSIDRGMDPFSSHQYQLVHQYFFLLSFSWNNVWAVKTIKNTSLDLPRILISRLDDLLKHGFIKSSIQNP